MVITDIDMFYIMIATFVFALEVVDTIEFLQGKR